MKAKANHWYEQNKERRTGADGDGKKGKQKVTFLCIRCSIVYGQVERSRDGGTSVARGSVDGSGSVDDASEATRNCAVGGADCGVGVARRAVGSTVACAILASELLIVRTVALASLNSVMETVVVMAAVVLMALLRL